MPRRRNCKSSDWLWVELKRLERAKQGKQTEFHFHDRICNDKKINKNVARNVTSNDVINARFGEMPETPEGWAATTPSAIDANPEYGAESAREVSNTEEPDSMKVTTTMVQQSGVSDLTYESDVLCDFLRMKGRSWGDLPNDLNELICYLGYARCPADVLRAALFLACKDGSGYTVEILLAEGVSPDSRNREGIPCLMVASWYNSESVVHRLIKAGADVVLTDRSGRTSWDLIHGSSKHELIAAMLWQTGVEHYNHKVLEAAAAGDVDEIQSAIKHGADPSYTPKNEWPLSSHAAIYGWTPLHYAAAYGNLEAARVLIEAGARINETTRWGETPLDIIQGFMSTPNFPGRALPTSDTIELLITNGAKESRIEWTGRRVLDVFLPTYCPRTSSAFTKSNTGEE